MKLFFPLSRTCQSEIFHCLTVVLHHREKRDLFILESPISTSCLCARFDTNYLFIAHEPWDIVRNSFKILWRLDNELTQVFEYIFQNVKIIGIPEGHVCSRSLFAHVFMLWFQNLLLNLALKMTVYMQGKTFLHWL